MQMVSLRQEVYCGRGLRGVLCASSAGDHRGEYAKGNCTGTDLPKDGWKVVRVRVLPIENYSEEAKNTLWIFENVR